VILLDTSVLISPEALELPEDDDFAFSALSYAELAFGVAVASDRDEREARRYRLAWLESLGVDWLPFDERAGDGYAAMAAIVYASRRAHTRSKDILIAGHAYALGAALATTNPKDFALVADHVRVIGPH
jgi:tRNA(fMet)-specific endonuclease VapC